MNYTKKQRTIICNLNKTWIEYDYTKGKKKKTEKTDYYANFNRKIQEFTSESLNYFSYFSLISYLCAPTYHSDTSLMIQMIGRNRCIVCKGTAENIRGLVWQNFDYRIY